MCRLGATLRIPRPEPMGPDDRSKRSPPWASCLIRGAGAADRTHDLFRGGHGLRPERIVGVHAGQNWVVKRCPGVSDCPL
jgi:hypothetical protein